MASLPSRLASSARPRVALRLLVGLVACCASCGHDAMSTSGPDLGGSSQKPCMPACGAGKVCVLGACHAPCDVLFSVDGGSTGSPAIGPDGHVYSVGIDGKLRAFSPDTGDLLWTSAESSGAGRSDFTAFGGVAVGGGHVYLGGVDGNLYAYGLDGKLAWKAPVTSDRLSSATPAIAPDSVGGFVVTSGYTNTVAAVNPDGTPRWQFQLGATTVARYTPSPAIAHDGTTYIGGWSDPDYYAINPDGTLKWKQDNGGSAVSSPSIGFDGTLYTGNHGPHMMDELASDGFFRAFHPDGTLAWKTQVGNAHGCSVLSRFGALFIGNDDSMMAIKRDGSVAWRAKTGGNASWPCAGNMVGDDGTVYVPVCPDKVLLLLSQNTGDILCKVPVDGYPSAPNVAKNGVMFIGSASGKLIAFVGTSTGLDASAAWPKHHHDPANTGRQP